MGIRSRIYIPLDAASSSRGFAVRRERDSIRSGGWRPRYARPMILQATVIAAQLFFHMQHRLIGALIGIRRIAFRAQRDLGIEMQRAFSAKAGPFTFERRVAGITAVK